MAIDAAARDSVGSLEDLQRAADGGQGPALPAPGGLRARPGARPGQPLPALGFPLHKGSIRDGILTCDCHHASSDLASGGMFDLWADDVPTTRTWVEDGEV